MLACGGYPRARGEGKQPHPGDTDSLVIPTTMEKIKLIAVQVTTIRRKAINLKFNYEIAYIDRKSCQRKLEVEETAALPRR